MKTVLNKLVRDHIPAICKKNGKTPETRILNEEEYAAALRTKLNEEVEEYLQSDDLEELADIVEVIEALAEKQGSSLDEILERKRKKQKKNGAFKNRIFLISVED